MKNVFYLIFLSARLFLLSKTFPLSEGQGHKILKTVRHLQNYHDSGYRIDRKQHFRAMHLKVSNVSIIQKSR